MTALDPRQVARAFGAILRAARVAAGLSQEVLAERADCDRSSLRFWNADCGNRPSG